MAKNKEETTNPEGIEVGDIIVHMAGHEGLVLDIIEADKYIEPTPIVVKVLCLKHPIAALNNLKFHYWMMAGFTVKAKADKGE